MTAEEISTATDQLMASMDEGVLTITLNRPEARNALTFELLDAFAEQLAYAESSSDVRCVVVTGGGKGFCAGGDVKAMAARNEGAHTVTVDEAIQVLVDAVLTGAALVARGVVCARGVSAVCRAVSIVVDPIIALKVCIGFIVLEDTTILTIWILLIFPAIAIIINIIRAVLTLP